MAKRTVKKLPPRFAGYASERFPEKRKLLAESIKAARQRVTAQHFKKYAEFGRAQGLSDYLYFLTESGEAESFLIEQARKVGDKNKMRYLDVGPGSAEYLKRTVRLESEEAKSSKFRNVIEKIEFHTISPENINSAKSAGGKEPGLHHHIGAVETYPAKRLGKFDFIVSRYGGTVYTPFFHETLVKVARLLKVGGRAYLHSRPEKEPFLHLEKLRKHLGEDFSVSLVSEFSGDLVLKIERRK